MKLKKLAVLAMACIMVMTASVLTGCSQNQGGTGTDETQNASSASSEVGDLQGESGNEETTTAEEEKEEETRDGVGDVKDVLADEPIEVTYRLMDYERDRYEDYTTTFSGIDLNKVNELYLEKVNEEAAQGILEHKPIEEYLQGYLEQAGYENFHIEFAYTETDKSELYTNKQYLNELGAADSQPYFSFILDNDAFYSAEIHDGHRGFSFICPYIYINSCDGVLPTVEEFEELVDFLIEYGHPEGVDQFYD